MGFSWRKSVGVLPGVRLNFSKRGVGASFGVKGLRLLIGSGRKPRINAGLGPIHYTKTLSSHPALEPQPPSRKLARLPSFDLPERGHYEPNATIFQKRKLEKLALERAGTDNRFFEIVDSLGRDQANYIILWCETKALQDARYSQEAFESEQRALEAKERDKQNARLWWAIPYVFVVIAAVYYFLQKANEPASVTNEPSATVAAPAARPSDRQTVAPAPSFAVPKPLPAAFVADVRYSQQAAVEKHPALSIPGSPLNKLFLSRLATWKARADSRLSRSDWPEVLADDCATNP